MIRARGRGQAWVPSCGAGRGTWTDEAQEGTLSDQKKKMQKKLRKNDR